MTSQFLEVMLASLKNILMLRSAVRPIRVKVDEVYRNLHRLCDVLEGNLKVRMIQIHMDCLYVNQTSFWMV